MALSAADRKSLLRELNEYGAVLYYLVNKKLMTVEEIENVLFKDNMEQVNLVFPKLIAKINPEEIDLATALYEPSFTKKDCLEMALNTLQDKYQHLREIKDVALNDTLADDILKDETYQLVLNTYFMNRILDRITKDKKDAFLRVKDLIKAYKRELVAIENENDQKICSDINNYYINSIVG